MLPRHSWVWLQPGAWQRFLATLPESGREPALRWQQQQWPLIVRRLPPAGPDCTSEIGLGLSLPPLEGLRPKLAWHCDASEVQRHQGPLEWAQLRDLMQVHAAANPQWLMWQGQLQQLDQALAAHAMRLALFGSLAWQAWTGLPYLHAGSDIDIFVRVENRQQLDALARLLPAALQAGLALDGEICFPYERAVAWREWLQAENGKVLVKQQQVYLCERRDLLQSLS